MYIIIIIKIIINRLRSPKVVVIAVSIMFISIGKVDPPLGDTRAMVALNVLSCSYTTSGALRLKTAAT